MEHLKILRKDKKCAFWIVTSFTILLVVLYPICIKNIYSYLLTTYNEVPTTGFLDSLYIVFMAVPFVSVICVPRIVQYISILIDIKKGTSIKEIIVSCEKPDTRVFDLYMLGVNKENDMYYVWKVKDENGKKMKMIYLKGVFSFVGKTIGHTYEVTYYKHSKVIVDVKKIK
ncbi:MAG: hypothetical protein J6B37_01980 [Clostridia bacterium]|nr:hypothetical protein [Clostridia bacterium]